MKTFRDTNERFFDFKMEIVVAKFGGTSMADEKAMLQSADVARQHNAAVIVVSATAGTTDQLIELSSVAQSKPMKFSENIVDEISVRHLAIAKELEASSQVVERLKMLIDELRTLTRGINLLREISPKTFDRLQGVGEQLSSALMVSAFKQLGEDVELLDARTIIQTNDHFGSAAPDVQATYKAAEKLRKQVRKGKKYVTQGFIGRSPKGSTTTLGRGGSDYSAALFAETAKADVLQIWTDVSGVASTDPRISPAAVHINEMSFQEAAEMATAGAKIIYAPSVMPARRADIPVFVGNTFAPDEGGTWIRESAKKQPLVRGITLKKNQILVTLRTPIMVHQYGFLARVFDCFARHKVSIDQVTTSEISVAVTLDNGALINDQLFKELQAIAEVQVEENLSLVSVIGNNVNHTPGFAREIFKSLQGGNDHISVRMICQGASKHNFCFLVEDKHGKESVKKLHESFIEQGVMA